MMHAFIPATPLSSSVFTPDSCACASALAATLPRHAPFSTARVRMVATTPDAVALKSYVTRGPPPTPRYNPTVDEFFAKDVRAQYIAKACPSGVPPLQCIEGATFDQPYALRTLKRQSQLRYRQLPLAARLRNTYETRKAALAACHGCSHEEERVLGNPIMAAAMAVGQAEASKACSRYIESSGPAEDLMCRAVENIYSKAVNPRGTFSTACTDGQAKYEAYLSAVRAKSTAFRAKQYSPGQKAGAAFAARKFATARDHICLYEDSLYSKYPRLAGSIRPANGYYVPFVTRPAQPSRVGGIDLDPSLAAALESLGKRQVGAE